MPDTLLFADDSITMRRVVELTFAEQGLQVVSVADGQQAIEYLTTHRPSLALVSATLQKVNGFDVARFIRDHAERRIPVLLLAGAFDTLDAGQVRESGAAGVLVKPFEPAVVIKRVKELLGMKSDSATADLAPAPSGSGRFVTSGDAIERSTPPPFPPSADSPAGDTARQPGDYFDQLDAAFDSLDAQLAARSAPAARPAPGSSAHVPVASEPASRPSIAEAFAELNAGPRHAAPATPAENPVFEIDNNWFADKPAPAAPQATEFVVTRASDFMSSPGPTPNDDRSWAPPGSTTHGTVAETPTSPAAPAPAHDPAPAPAAAAEASVPDIFGSAAAVTAAPPATDIFSAPAPAPETAARDFGRRDLAEPAFDRASAPSAGASAHEDSPRDLRRDPAEAASGRTGGPTAPSFGAADAFAMLWAQEQGEAVPAPPPPLPVELGEQTVETLSSQVTGRVADRLSADFDSLASRLSDDLVARLAPQVTDRVSERLADGLAERVAELVAERALAGTLGDSLRQTVNEVAERVVRAEIERIRTAAAAQRSS